MEAIIVIFGIIGLGVLILQIVMIVKFFEIASDIRALRERFQRKSEPVEVVPETRKENHESDAKYASSGGTWNVTYNYYIKESSDDCSVMAIDLGHGNKGDIFIYKGGGASFKDSGVEYIYETKNSAIDALYEFLSKKTIRQKNLIRKKTGSL